MTVFKAGYYIDEFNIRLEKIVGKATLKSFFNNSLFFNISDLPDYFNNESINPLLKVVWNIISRGEPTRLSILLAENILTEHLKEDFLGVSYNKPEIDIKINEAFFNEIESRLLLELLSNFGKYNESRVAQNLGTKYLKIYRIFLELISSAQIQRTILLLIFTELTNKDNHFDILGIRDSLQKEIVNDLNNLFNHLNDLAGKDEEKIQLISLEKSSTSTKISFNIQTPNSFVINSLQSKVDNPFNKILTDRRIQYRQLGIVKEEEIQKKYVQRFEYKTNKQEMALIYFLQNIFRKSKFRAGQEAIINRAIQGKDVIGLLPTGGGKSLTYQICALLQPGVTIVVDPINSLMKDQFDKLINNGITKTNFINSFNTKDEREKNIEELTESKYLILFVSPERFQIENFRMSLANCNYNNVFYSYAVIDEAHCVSEWGHDFRHSYLKLAQNLKRFCKPKTDSLTLFGLTATASFDVLADVQRELEMPENAIISLPAEAIDREELNYEILPINCEVPKESQFYTREKIIGRVKYPIIKFFVEQLPAKIEKLENKYGYFTPSKNFYNIDNQEYKNAGLIFCPTKSNKLPNGVLTLNKYLSKLDFLKTGTFFGSGDDDTVKDKLIESEAELSYKNQEAFIENKNNLMIATKAFGMGIDKPNIRFSIHYSFPSSVESFYQEAGRAGRDGYPSICSIVYHPDDIQTNYDFYRNAFKGIIREKEIINELLEEVKYEDNFYINVLKRQLQDKFPEFHSLNLYIDNYIYLNGKNEFIFTNGKWKLKEPNKAIKIGRITLNKNLDDSPKDIQNFDPIKSKEITDYLKILIKELCSDGNYAIKLMSKSSEGIKTLIESKKNDSYSLKIGFINDTITKMTEVLKGVGYNDFEDVIIRAAYNFSSYEVDFISNINYQYYKYQINKYGEGYATEEFKPNPETSKYLLENYCKIRNTADTQRAIYRMSVVGIIDDYIIDYVGNFIEVRFKAKSDTEYIENFKSYLKRYLGNQSTDNWIKKVNEKDDDSILKKVLYTLIEFIEFEISDKRKRAIDFMKELCEVYLKDGEKNFRERIVTYFTSKYARTNYLPTDTENGKKENCAIVKKYINFIFDPPDKLGGQIDNAKHLRGACDNLRIGMIDNASIDLLTSFSFFALDAKENDTIDNAMERPLINQAITLYRKGFRRLIQKEKWDECKGLIKLFNEKVLDLNSVIKPLITPLTNELLINRTTYRLHQFLNKIT